MKLAVVVRMFAAFFVCLFASVRSDGAPARGVSPEEREAPLALYENTNGGNWKNHEGWLGPKGSECEWRGVECQPSTSDAAQIVSLDLSENNPRGRIPGALSDLRSLDALFLEGNRLDGLLPEPLMTKWLNGSLWMRAEASLLTNCRNRL